MLLLDVICGLGMAGVCSARRLIAPLLDAVAESEGSSLPRAGRTTGRSPEAGCRLIVAGAAGASLLPDDSDKPMRISGLWGVPRKKVIGRVPAVSIGGVSSDSAAAEVVALGALAAESADRCTGLESAVEPTDADSVLDCAGAGSLAGVAGASA